MSVWHTPLGMNVINNPIVESLYVQQVDIGFANPVPPTGPENLLTEGGDAILTEGGDIIATE